MQAFRGATGATALVLGLGLLAGCTGRPGAAGTARPASAGDAAVPVLMSPSPAPSVLPGGCGNPSDVKILRVVGLSSASASPRQVVVFPQQVECGPGIPDDVVYDDLGPAREYPLASDVKITVSGVDPSRRYAVTLPELAKLAGGGSYPDVDWNDGLCEAILDPSGRVVELEGFYTP